MSWFLFISLLGHYCVGGVAVPCPAGSYGPKEGLQRLKDCAICPAGTALSSSLNVFNSKDLDKFCGL